MRKTAERKHGDEGGRTMKNEICIFDSSSDGEARKRRGDIAEKQPVCDCRSSGMLMVVYTLTHPVRIMSKMKWLRSKCRPACLVTEHLYRKWKVLKVPL